MNTRNEHYDVKVEKPEELKNILSQLLNDPASVSHEYILYKLGQRESLIKVNKEGQLWHYDLLGRPMAADLKKIMEELTIEFPAKFRFNDLSGNALTKQFHLSGGMTLFSSARRLDIADVRELMDRATAPAPDLAPRLDK